MKLIVTRISNAALHWILRDESTRPNVIKSIYDSLKPQGKFVFEMGGHGNVAEVHTALLAALTRQGVSIEKARESSPWFFPSDAWVRRALEDVGFHVEKLEVEHRPTKLTSDPKGGIEGWVRLMGSELIDILSEEQREDAVKDVCQLLETIITRHEDGTKWLGYVRLRGIASK